MAKLGLHQLGPKLKRKRGSRGVRDVANEIGISPATLSRVERGNLPDLQTFAKICSWLEIDPADVLGIDMPRAASGQNRPEIAATAHFRGEKTTTPELAKALADLILAAQRRLEREAKGE